MTNLPVTGAFRVTCEYGRKGSLWSSGYHKGIDLVCDDRNVYCTCDGTVKTVGWDPNGWGRYVRVQEKTTGLIHIFCHLVRDSVRVSVGQAVSRLSVLGTMGTTGNSTGVHLHFQIEDAARKVYDPTSWLGIPNAVGSYHSNDYQIKTEPAQSPSTSKPEVKEEVSVLDQFKDKASISSWATASVEKAVKKGVLKGTDKGTLEPALPVTREQLAVILDRLGMLD